MTSHLTDGSGKILLNLGSDHTLIDLIDLTLLDPALETPVSGKADMLHRSESFLAVQVLSLPSGNGARCSLSALVITISPSVLLIYHKRHLSLASDLCILGGEANKLAALPAHDVPGSFNHQCLRRLRDMLVKQRLRSIMSVRACCVGNFQRRSTYHVHTQ
jgi:hypothetical protein